MAGQHLRHHAHGRCHQHIEEENEQVVAQRVQTKEGPASRKKEVEEGAVPAKVSRCEEGDAALPSQEVASEHRPIVGYKVAVEVG
jgi:hypothetical protein